MNNNIDEHYHNAVNVYESSSHFILKPYYEEFVMKYLNKLFAFEEYSSSIRIVDLGCGNGSFVNKFISYINPLYIEDCIGVDPYAEWMTVTSAQSNIKKTMCIGAYDFSKIPAQQMNYSHLLMKEMIHHIDSSNLSDIFYGIYEQLCENGKVIIITRPVETNYPFFERIHQFWKITQPPYKNVVLAMKEAGFDVHVEIATLPVTVPKNDWLSFIKNKTWSVFSMCSEKEMNDGLYILNNELLDDVSFDETLIFIVGHKKIITQ